MSGIYRANLTDKAQSELESSAFKAGIPVFDNAETKVIAKGAQTAPQRTQNAGSTLRANAGVILPHDDKPNSFPSDTIGKP